ncbi:outer dynein arm-docking complex subunit 2-like isoform X2 [Acropora palmata]|uniref:outer dynein arm-docking complex subunit 2-like isoform X2 n=1 Tax=Acropora palmata TaxID=6131 RepID=UPI003DA07868
MSDLENEMDLRFEELADVIRNESKRETRTNSAKSRRATEEEKEEVNTEIPQEQNISPGKENQEKVTAEEGERPQNEFAVENFQSSFLDKYLSESESDEDEQQESKEREMSTKGNKRKVKKKVKRKVKKDKGTSQLRPSPRWRNLRIVVGKDSDEEENNSITPLFKEAQFRQERKTTAPKITSEQIESSTESEEEDDRVLDGKVNVADLPSEFWQIQRLVKYLRIGALKVLQQLTINSKYNRRTVIKLGGVQILIDLITDAPREVQGLAAANLANMAKSSLGRNIMKRYSGIQRLVGLLNYDDGKKNYRRQSNDTSADLEVARNAALALWSCSKSTRSRSAIYNAGSVPLLAKLIKLDKEEFLIPIVGLAQECAVETRFREAFYKENMIETIVHRLQTENQELQGYCASAIYKCAEDEQTRKAVYDCGALNTLVSLLYRRDNKKLLSAVTGAIWKCAISEYNVKSLMAVKVAETLFKLLQNEEGKEEELPEQIQLHIVGAIGEIAKDPNGPLEVLRCKGCQTLVDILNIPNEELTGTAARAIAACAVDTACRSVFNRLECLRLLWSLLKSRNNKVVSGAAWAVYRLMQDTPEAWEIARSFVGGLDLIVGLLKSDDLEVLTSACAVISVIACDRENLGVLTDYDVVSHLAYLTNKKDTLLRHHLAEAIAMCSKWGNNAKRFCDKGAVKSMVEYLGSVDIIVQRSAMRALEQLGKSPESCIIMHRGGVVKLLLEMIGSEDAGLQVAAAGCLLNMRELAMANEQARQEQWNSNSN